MKTLSQIKLIISILLLQSITSFSQTRIFDFAEPINKVTLSNTYDISAGDLDKDGYIDIVVAERGSNTIAWYKNSNGTFSNIKIITNSFLNASNTELADIDGDGDLDIIAGNGRRDELVWFENLDGKGNFSKIKIIHNETSDIEGIVADDIDGDGDMDILASYWDGKQIAYFKNIDGKGQFGDKVIIEKRSSSCRSLKFFDIDGDNKKDIIATWAQESKLVWYKNNGNLSFSKAIAIDSSLNYPSNLMIADIDKDGDNDIFCHTNKEIVWYNNLDSKGNFSDKKQLLNENRSGEFILAKDMDNDGFIDLVAGLGYSDKIVWFKNLDGQGNFSEPKKIVDNLKKAFAIAVADFDNNNTLDVCGAGYNNDKLVLLKNLDGKANFSSPIILDEAELKTPSDMIEGDFDSDGDIDIIVANEYSNNLIMYKNYGNYFIFQPIDSYDAETQLLEKIDVDGDGNIDIVCSRNNGSDSQIVWYKNNGNANFVFADTISENDYIIDQIIIKDLNGDDKPDIITLSTYSDNISWYKNNGSSFSTAKTISNSFPRPSRMSSNDIDNDGDNDLVVVSYQKSLIKYFTNTNGDGVFSNPVSIPDEKNNPEDIITIDFDNDGDNDIIYPSSGNSSIFLHKNTNGTFSNAIKLTKPYNVKPSRFLLNDLDKDGDLDLIGFQDYYKFSVFWIENINGTFDKVNIILTNNNDVVKIIATDINKDNLIDLLSLNESSNNLLLNKGIIAPQYSKHPTNKHICGDTTVEFSVDFTFADSIRWKKKRSYQNTFSSIKNDSIYSGATSKTLRINANHSLDKDSYMCSIFYKNYTFHSKSALLEVNKFIEALAGEDKTTCENSLYLNGNYHSQGTGKWSVIKGSAIISNPEDNGSKITNLSSGENIFRWTITNGVCTDSDDVTITKNENVIITSQPDNVQVNLNETATFEVSYTGDVLSFLWYKDGTAISDNSDYTGTQTSKLTITSVNDNHAGDYYCYINGKCNNLNTEPATLSILTKTSDLFGSNIEIYPNPVIDELHIKTEETIKDITISTINGTKAILKENKIKNNTLDLRHLAKGTYILLIKTNKNTFRYKFIKID